jgi:very-short-patch-repair endonuclease
MEELETSTEPLTLSIDCALRINFATAQNSVPVLRSIGVANHSESALENLVLTMKAQPAFVREKSWQIDRIASNGEASLTDRSLTLDLEFLSGLNEAEQGQLIFTLAKDGDTLLEQVVPIEVMARDEWGGVAEMAQILAAFVSPNHAAVAPILKEAARSLVAAGHSGSQNGYQSGDPARAYMLTAAIWSAITGMGLTYAEPPKSFERVGQKVRDPQRITSEGLATCFDTALLFAAAIEAAGLNPVVIFTEGHAFAGVWLTNKTLPGTIERDVTELRKAIAAHEFVPFETTLVTNTPPAGFEEAVKAGTRKLGEAYEAEFDRAIDITRARSAGVKPLASHQVRDAQVLEVVPIAPAALPAAPDFDCLPGELADETPDTPSGRIERWQRKLLDLSLRNRLLNFASSKQTLPFLCPDVPKLEDILADGARLRVISLTDEDPVGDRDPEAFRRERGKDIHDAFAIAAMERKQICVPLTGQDMSKRLVTLFRRAKSDLAEGGTNTLFLATGFLRWKKSEDDDRTYRAPLLLLPVALKRRSAQADFYLSHHEDDIRINSTLFEFLKRDFGLQIPSLEGDLPTDESGLDLPHIFETMRQAVREVPGFEVVEELALSTFSFAKYLMWKDLVDRTDQLRENRLVEHLIDNPDKPFSGVGTNFPTAEDVDRRFAPKDLMLPLPADSSQISAVLAAAGGHDFVVVGPPGTGKSQTIGNMIAHCLAHGKSVLFVAEKSAALDVVHRRLKHYGLGDACLELHSNKADRRSVISQLGAAWDRSADACDAEWVNVTSKLKVDRDTLNSYVEALHKKGTHGFSAFRAIGIVAGTEGVFQLSFKSMSAHDATTYAKLEEVVIDAARTYPVVKDCTALQSISNEEWSFAWQNELLLLSDKLSAACEALAGKAVAFEVSLGTSSEADLSLDRLGPLSQFAKVATATASGDFQVALDPEFDRLAASMTELETAITSVRKERARLSASYEDAEIARIPVESIDQAWREAESRMWPFSALAKRRTRKLLQTYTASGVCDPSTDIAPLRLLQGNLESVLSSDLSNLPKFEGVDTEPDTMRGYLEDASELRDAIRDLARIATDAAALSATLTPLLKTGGERDPVFKLATEFDHAHAEFEVAQAALAKHSGGALLAESFGALQEELKAISSEKGHIADWAKWVAVRSVAIERSLSPLVDALESGQEFSAIDSFRNAYFTWWLPHALDSSPVLRDFAHWEHKDLRKRFRELDEAAQGLAAQQVCRALIHDLPARDSVARKSELGVLRHQLGLQRPSISIRDLIGSMPKSITKLAPCVLMSPLSVAQYLPTDHSLFDIVIFDEASQITTWDAVGAIARGQQSVIVGDPKQLPPMNFFGRSNDDEEDLEVYERDLASILDEAAAAGLPNLQLNWHYRSRDEALIAFSNHHYYGNRLVTFPSPATDSNALCFHKNDGVYARGSGGTNEVEAREIAAFAVNRLKEWLERPEEDRLTLGVITFNIHQQELILDLLDAARRESPELEWFFDDDREEQLIVKNLENIQGDERDVMLFSITFGPDSAGKITMNFGAVNSDGGEKRLNVAVTRAREELHVFSSITADDIDLSRTKARGVADLKNFLDYASRGAIALPAMDHGSLGPAENMFEEAIASALEAKGWEVRTQIGVSGFRIDLAVVHPHHAGGYLAGVECDGATYHSSASARDRDKIREGVLENLGWNILRIWSTDWFRNPADTIERTDSDLRTLLESYEVVEESEKETGESAMPLEAVSPMMAAPSTQVPEADVDAGDVFPSVADELEE